MSLINGLKSLYCSRYEQISITPDNGVAQFGSYFFVPGQKLLGKTVVHIHQENDKITFSSEKSEPKITNPLAVPILRIVLLIPTLLGTICMELAKLTDKNFGKQILEARKFCAYEALRDVNFKNADDRIEACQKIKSILSDGDQIAFFNELIKNLDAGKNCDMAEFVFYDVLRSSDICERNDYEIKSLMARYVENNLGFEEASETVKGLPFFFGFLTEEYQLQLTRHLSIDKLLSFYKERVKPSKKVTQCINDSLKEKMLQDYSQNKMLDPNFRFLGEFRSLRRNFPLDLSWVFEEKYDGFFKDFLKSIKPADLLFTKLLESTHSCCASEIEFCQNEKNLQKLFKNLHREQILDIYKKDGTSQYFQVKLFIYLFQDPQAMDKLSNEEFRELCRIRSEMALFVRKDHWPILPSKETRQVLRNVDSKRLKIYIEEWKKMIDKDLGNEVIRLEYHFKIGGSLGPKFYQTLVNKKVPVFDQVNKVVSSLDRYKDLYHLKKLTPEEAEELEDPALAFCYYLSENARENYLQTLISFMLLDDKVSTNIYNEILTEKEQAFVDWNFGLSTLKTLCLRKLNENPEFIVDTDLDDLTYLLKKEQLPSSLDECD